MADLERLALHDLHVELGAKMVPFAGYEMPVQYPTGVMTEHQHTRTQTGVFDVSHMGQVILRAPDYATLAAALESLIPVDVLALKPGRQRYGFFTNAAGGIMDDLMFANRGDHVFMVVNAACKAADIAHLRSLEPTIEVEEITDRALLAVQGPGAEAALGALCPEVREMRFMDVATVTIAGSECWVSRSGYTGEDGYEVSIPVADVDRLARAILAVPGVLPIGLGARDSLRLEAGLCLYGHDIDIEITPVEAGLNWAMQKVRRTDGARAGGFPGADVILAQLGQGAGRARVGLVPQGRAPMREGVEIFAEETGGVAIGRITSGGFGPTFGGPVAMGYVPTALAAPGTVLYGELRGKRLPISVASLPFVPANFKR